MFSIAMWRTEGADKDIALGLSHREGEGFLGKKKKRKKTKKENERHLGRFVRDNVPLRQAKEARCF